MPKLRLLWQRHPRGHATLRHCTGALRSVLSGGQSTTLQSQKEARSHNFQKRHP